jgi:hypothetical protein
MTVSHDMPTSSSQRPRRVGRLVRLALGIASLLFALLVVVDGRPLLVAGAPPTNLLLWSGMALGLYVFADVVNVGWALRLGVVPPIAVLTLAAALSVWSLAHSGGWWPHALGWLVYVWLLYTWGHLGVSYVVAGLLATPGCEMRAIPHLWSLLTRRAPAEQACQGVVNLDTIDAWERRKSPPDGAGEHATNSTK